MPTPTMASPATLTHPDCRCGHDHASHFEDGFAPQCTAAHCECVQYRPATQRLEPVGSTGGGASIDQLIAAGKRSSAKRIATLAAELERRANRLRVLLDEQRGKAEAARKAEADKQAARREVERLEAELAAAKAKLRGKPTPAAPTVKRDTRGRRVVRDPTPKVCPDCGQTFQNVGVHRARAHGYRTKQPA